RARVDLVGQGITVARRAAEHGVGDPDVLPAHPDLLEHPVEQLPGGPDERFTLLVLVVPRALPDEHQVRVRVARAVDDLGPALREPAPRARRRLERRLLERPHPVSPTAGAPGTPVASRTPLRIDSATARWARRSRTSCAAGTWPVASVNTVSPSQMVWEGRTTVDTASCEAMASRCARSLDRRAFVATTPMTVLDQGPRGHGVSEEGSPVSGLAPAIGSPSSPRISPSALTANRAPTITSPSSAAAVPTPPFTWRSGPWSLATVAPVPAPTLPSSTSSEAASQAAYPSLGPGRALGSPTPRSNRTAAGTIGTTARPAGNPTPRSSRYRTTPSAAASPNALPPVSRTAFTCSTSIPGRSRSVSRVPGAPPRTSPEPTVPGGASTTVHPVSPTRSVAWPTRIPGTRVITIAPRSRRRRPPAARSPRRAAPSWPCDPLARRPPGGRSGGRRRARSPRRGASRGRGPRPRRARAPPPGSARAGRRRSSARRAPPSRPRPARGRPGPPRSSRREAGRRARTASSERSGARCRPGLQARPAEAGRRGGPPERASRASAAASR